MLIEPRQRQVPVDELAVVRTERPDLHAAKDLTCRPTRVRHFQERETARRRRGRVESPLTGGAAEG